MTLSKEELSGLAERVRGLKGPDREVDGDIALAFGMPPNHLTRREDGWLWYQFVEPDDFDTWEAPPFTGSADAALALVERVQPGWKRSLFEKRGGGWVSRISSPRWETYSSGEDTPLPAAPIALTLALLLSLQSQEPTL